MSTRIERDQSRVETLLQMLTYRRPAGTKTERRFIREFIEPLGVTKDAMGNLWKAIGKAPTILWSCHTDTVHKEGGNQHVVVDKGIAGLPARSKSNCLGADDTAGVWLMCEMIRASVPGLYVFHRGEERGGIGSSYIADETPELLAGITFAIAFDRRGYIDVITHQGFGRCCSDAFARSLADQLEMGYAPCDGGVFTDTANYTGLIGECTNISVGYFDEHTSRETLDISHVLTLRESLLRLDVSKLVAKRKPGDSDPDDYGGYYGGGRYNGTRQTGKMGWDYVWDDDQQPRKRISVVDLVRAHPEEIADVLEAYGVTSEELLQELWTRGAVIRNRY